VLVFDTGNHPLGRLVPPGIGSWMRDSLDGAGIRFVAGTGVAEAHREGAGLRLVDTKGATHVVDAVLSAVGLRPNLELARSGGLSVNRGIVVDRYLRTSDPDIHALGDCAEVDGLVLPFVQPILHAARALAKTLSGTPTELRYPAMPVLVKTPSAPLVVCPPPIGSIGEWREEPSGSGRVAVFLDPSSKPLGFALAGEATKEKGAWAARIPDWL
jgi:rubredoxin-NAD+ reductase